MRKWTLKQKSLYCAFTSLSKSKEGEGEREKKIKKNCLSRLVHYKK